MDAIHLVAVFLIFAGIVTAQDKPEFEDPSGRVVQKGDTLSMKCTVNSGTPFLLKKQLRFVHKNSKTQKPEILSEQAVLVAPYSEGDTYKLDFQYDPTVNARLDISNVEDSMDGQFLCEVVDVSSGAVTEHASINVTVAAGVETLELTVGENAVTDDMSKPLSFREAEIEVRCSASGTNPQPIIHLYLDGEPLTDAMNVLADDGFDRRSFRGSVTHVLDFKHTMFGKKLSCHAMTEPITGFSGKLAEKTVSAVLEGVVDEPTIYCTNNTAGGNDRQVTLKCLVSVEPKIKSASFRIRDNKVDKHVLYPGDKTDSLIECYENVLNATFKEYTLKFYQMEEWHFTANIYFDVEGFDNKVHQRSVYLIKDTSAAPSLTATIALQALCLLAMLLNSLV